MTQATLGALNPATTSGAALASLLTAAEDAVHSTHKGSSAPVYAQAGMLWIDDTTSTHILNYYDGTSWIPIARFNSTSHRKQQAAAEVDVASAGTANVLGAASDFVRITGTTTITSLGSEPLQIKFVRFAGALTLTHNATTLILPTAANIVTIAGDTMIVASDASGNARVFNYLRASGLPLAEQAQISEFAATTAAIFVQASAPTGWTKQTTNDNRAIRITTGTGGGSQGGSLNFDTVFGYTDTDDVTLTKAMLPIYNLDLTGLSITIGSLNLNNGTGVTRNLDIAGDSSTPHGDSTSFDYTRKSKFSFSNDTVSIGGAPSKSGSIPLGGSATPHSHNIDMRVRYVNAIICTKN